MTSDGSYASTRSSSESPSWQPAFYSAVPISLLLLGLFYYWFGVANRYDIFLYGHTAKGISITQPFDVLTSSRYWMAGLVGSGIVMVFYTAVHLLLARLQKQYRAPAWWHVWVLCLPAVLVGIPVIAMTVNSPTLPPLLALACVAATLAGLALALLPAEIATQKPSELLWLTLDGAGLMPCLMFIHAVELPGQGLSISQTAAFIYAAGGTLCSAVWLAIVTGLRKWRQRPQMSARALLAAGLCFTYLLLPLTHYVFATPVDHRYISAASNFFASSPALQGLTFVIAAGLAGGFSLLRKRLW
jgi:hypothetical protein